MRHTAIPDLAERRGALLHGLLRALLLVLELRFQLGQLGALIVTVVLRRAPRVARARLLVLGGLQRRCLVLELGLPRPLEVVERVGVASLTVTRSCEEAIFVSLDVTSRASSASACAASLAAASLSSCSTLTERVRQHVMTCSDVL